MRQSKMSQKEAELAAKVENSISTHQWSLMAEEFGSPDYHGKLLEFEAPKIEAWYYNLNAGEKPLRKSTMTMRAKHAWRPSFGMPGLQLTSSRLRLPTNVLQRSMSRAS